MVTHYKKFHMDFYFGEKDSFEVAENILHACLNKKTFGKNLNRNIIKWSDKLIQNAKATASLPLQQLSNKELWQLYKKQDAIHTKLYTYGWLPVALDMFHNNFTKKLKAYLYGVCNTKDQAESAFLALTTPTQKTIVAKERENFLKIYTKYLKNIKAGVLSAPLKAELAKHSKSWGHLGYIYAGNVKPFGVEHYFKELKDLASTVISAKKLLAKETAQLLKARKQQAFLTKKLKISGLYQVQFQSARDFAITKLYRRHAQLLHLYLMHQSLLPEIAKRLQLTRYQVQFMLMDEVKEALLYGKSFKQTLKTRFKECILYTEKNLETIYTGREAKKSLPPSKSLIPKTSVNFPVKRPSRALPQAR